MAEANICTKRIRATGGSLEGPGNSHQPNGSTFIYMRASGDQPRRELARQLRNNRRAAAEARPGSFARRTFVDVGRAHVGVVRPALRIMIEQAKAGQAAMLVVECLDRLSRDHAELEHLVTELELAGVKIVTASQGHISMEHVSMRGIMADRDRKLRHSMSALRRSAPPA
ncbi:recombinase family protein [Methylobacterium mesophilicum]